MFIYDQTKENQKKSLSLKYQQLVANVQVIVFFDWYFFLE
jgi:hypothetical protein